MAIAFLNGDWMQPEEAKVSVFDRGFMFGDGVYEVMPVYGGRVFTLEEHVERLLRSLLNKFGWKRLITKRLGQH